jgi:GNAT superfamily N-acetyltransferase
MTLTKTHADQYPPVAIERATFAEDRTTVARVFADAFQDDPTFMWCIPDPSRRRAILPAFFDVFVWAYSHHNETYLANSPAGTVGATLWAPAGAPLIAAEDEEEFVARLDAVVGPRADQERLHQIMELLESHHPDEDLQYLQFFGVLSTVRGRGIGSQLLSEMTNRCDIAGIAMYHEATSPRNRALYEKHGYTCLDAISVADSPPLWRMLREPH